MSLPIAHFGGTHWWMLVLYAVPVLIVLGSIVMSVIRERKLKPVAQYADQSVHTSRKGADG